MTLNNFEEGRSSSLRVLIEGPNPSNSLISIRNQNRLDEIYGPVWEKMNSSEKMRLNVLIENIDKTRPVELRRIGLLFTLLNEKHGIEAIDYYDFNDKEKELLIDSITNINRLRLINSKVEMKRLISEIGWESFEFLHNLDKAEHIVYNSPPFKLESHILMLEAIKRGEPVMIEDLSISTEDLFDAQITVNQQTAEKLMMSLLAAVHKKPQLNQKEELLILARKMNRNKFHIFGRYINWVK